MMGNEELAKKLKKELEEVEAGSEVSEKPRDASPESSAGGNRMDERIKIIKLRKIIPEASMSLKSMVSEFFIS